MRGPRIFLIAALILAGGALWYARETVKLWWNVGAVSPSVIASRPKPDPATYATLTVEAERWRKELSALHSAARTPLERAAIEDDARAFLELILPEMMRCWLGTPWDFHGTSSTPGEGKIACGYFVSTVLRDAGFRVDRFRLAQQPSGNILHSFLKKSETTLTVGIPYDSFASSLQSAGPGIYIVGLDTHVAFLVASPEEFRFIHSSGSRPWCVVDESRQNASVLAKSNWRMIGNLTANRDLIRRWLAAEKIKVHGT